MRRLVLCAALFWGLGTSACVTRESVKPVYDSRGIEVELRGFEKNGEPVDRGYNQPASISLQRMTNVLTAVEFRVEEEDSTGLSLLQSMTKDEDSESQDLNAIVTADTLEPVAKAMVVALAEADSSQQVVVKAVRKQRRLGIFHSKFYTGFIAYVEGNYLYIHLSHLNREIENDPKVKIPDPEIGKASGTFRAVPSSTMHAVGPYALAVRWRDPYFSQNRRPITTKGVRTRTILMESEVPTDELGASLPSKLSDNLSPETLRALADLEEERRAGKVNETQYRMRRDDILTGTPAD